MKKKSDEDFMSQALAQAIRGRGHTSPNPMVGAVLVKNQRVLAEGFHRRAGLPHAEIEALRRTKNARGATLYVTLEPCCHLEKRTPPCVESLIQAGLKRVVIGALDPNPQVNGRGVKILKKAGIEVSHGVLGDECAQLNYFYNHWIATGRPWVVMKSAASLDGRVALKNKNSRWISGAKSREWVHRLRGRVDAILVGIGTVLADNPRLTARLPESVRQPVRIILDARLQMPPQARVLAKNQALCWVVIDAQLKNSAKAKRLQSRGVELLPCSVLPSGVFDLKKLMRLLGEKKILSVLVEGGPQTWKAFLEQGCAEEWVVFVAPKILGGDALPLVPPLQLQRMGQALAFQLRDFEVCGEDVLLGYRLME